MREENNWFVWVSEREGGKKSFADSIYAIKLFFQNKMQNYFAKISQL